jgi:hypothetical protein
MFLDIELPLDAAAKLVVAAISPPRANVGPDRSRTRPSCRQQHLSINELLLLFRCYFG